MDPTPPSDHPENVGLKKDVKELLHTAAQHWSQKTATASPPRVRWWQSDTIVRHVNKRICGKALPGLGAGDIEMIRSRFPGQSFPRAISIGCGSGAKEMDLIRSGLVGTFDLYELSEIRVAQGLERAKKLGLSARVIFRNEIPDFDRAAETYDLMYWNNALHHMLDVDAAVSWSQRVLKSRGVFFMNDFVGPTRMQWSDRTLDIASGVRAALPERYLWDPRVPGKQIPREVKRPDPAGLAAGDPTKAADSSRILESVRRYFPDAQIKLTGGVVYRTALNDVLHSISETDDRHLLDLLLLLDEVATLAGETQYEVTISRKSYQGPPSGQQQKMKVGLVDQVVGSGDVTQGLALRLAADDSISGPDRRPEEALCAAWC